MADLADELSEFLAASLTRTLDQIDICLLIGDDILDRRQEGTTTNYLYSSSGIEITLSSEEGGVMAIAAVLDGNLCGYDIEDPVEAAATSLQTFATVINYGTKELERLIKENIDKDLPPGLPLIVGRVTIEAGTERTALAEGEEVVYGTLGISIKGVIEA